MRWRREPHQAAGDRGAHGPAGRRCLLARDAEYEAKWRVALGGDLAELGDSMEPAAVEDIISGQLATLPDREELTKLRSVYAVVDLFVSDAPWPVAFTAADRAIEVCGEGAKRPGPG